MDNQTKLNEKNPLRRISGRYLKWTAYGLLLLGTAILQMAPRVFPPVFGARPLLLVPVIISIAMFEGPIGGAAAGIAGGLLWDLYADRLFGFNALFLMAIGCACGLLVRLLIRNNLLSALLLFAGGLLVQGLMDWFFNYVLLLKDNPLFVLVRLTLPDMGYTLVVSPALYGLTLLVAKILRKRD
jgi:rod shape-determining protein mreD